ncbi:MAG TPA: PAS domain-containing protein, partial [Stellaceae bacterium]|nr:PAS domain-containing protein [Stellaceae bacterium]
MVILAAALLASVAAIGFGALWFQGERRLRAQQRSAADLEHARVEAAHSAQRACGEAARLRETLDLLPLPVWRRDRDGAIVECNRPYAAMFGISRETALAEDSDLA